MSQADSFLMLCRECSFLKLFPAALGVKETDQYQRLKNIVQSYISDARLDDFAGFLFEGHYFVQLWTAHLIIEYSSPDLDLKKRCIELITEYTNNPLAPDVAKQEKIWLENYYRFNNQ